MKKSNGKSTAILAGAAAGSVLTALMAVAVFGLHTGIAGAVLVLLIAAVSTFSGWMIGWNQHIQKWNYYSYMKGYREGLEAKVTGKGIRLLGGGISDNMVDLGD